MVLTLSRQFVTLTGTGKAVRVFFILVINQLDAQNLFYNKISSCLYMFEQHVLIVRRSELYYTASGIITPNVMIHLFILVILDHSLVSV